MNFWKDIFDIIQKIVISLGIIIGGIWTYFLFVRQRLGLPKLSIDLIIEEVLLPKNTKLVHVEVNFINIGNVILTSNYAELRLRQIVPIPKNLVLEKNCDPIPKDRTEFEWPMIAGREWNWNYGDFEIEPAERDSLHADFFIPTEVKTSEFYFYIANAKKKRKGIGWSQTKIYNFKIKENMKMSDNSKKQQRNNRKHIQKQQRQQKQQKPQNQQQQDQNQPKKDSNK